MALVVTTIRAINRKNRSLSLNLADRLGYCVSQSNLAFVPKCEPVKSEEVELLKQFLRDCGKICVVTGAGISTESGIPDYRSEGVGLYATSNRRPMSYQDFCKSEKNRKRYWARNYAAWPSFSLFQPNYTHKWLKSMEDIGKVNCVITQNVDYLHRKAGSKNVIELHGTGYNVKCMRCERQVDRFEFQKILDELNPSLKVTSTEIRPDGDVELTQEQADGFVVPPCSSCGGILKPNIVFFGDNVARNVVEQVKNEVEDADSLLVLGTSLTTFSGYRIILQATEAVKPIAIVNIGDTRGDSHAQLKIRGRCGEILESIGNKL
ncbi:NAD-dependent protein deacylase Sirt4-like [Trichogramma pretiosum]|uniref:NAD-dependent protein deacylase Sirt4-like n=1 Tax=Trichogramma pretiosum TaxID=7493 RepID=UPI0006C97C40|nr:NAD-dependent protein deacylase Sirt4-like [Trichogramma pretiosum]